MRDFPGIMLFQASAQVARDSNIVSRWLLDAPENVNVDHANILGCGWRMQ
jgi:uncharacterized membrane protein